MGAVCLVFGIGKRDWRCGSGGGGLCFGLKGITSGDNLVVYGHLGEIPVIVTQLFCNGSGRELGAESVASMVALGWVMAWVIGWVSGAPLLRGVRALCDYGKVDEIGCVLVCICNTGVACVVDSMLGTLSFDRREGTDALGAAGFALLEGPSGGDCLGISLEPEGLVVPRAGLLAGSFMGPGVWLCVGGSLGVSGWFIWLDGRRFGLVGLYGVVDIVGLPGLFRWDL
ncbi:hypothetical protein Tco_1266138 [Tanacetum coccineum]